VISRRQLLAAGLGSRAIERRLEAGRLHRLFRGVYALGHAKLSQRSRWMAAVLAGGPDAVLSHRSAAPLWGLMRARGTQIEVSAQYARGRPGIAVHQSRMGRADRTVRDGIPVTTVARTLFDLAESEEQCLKSAFEVDALWPREQPIVELDGFSFHRHRAAFERDRARDARLQAGGYRVVRLTYRRLADEPSSVAAEIRRLLRPNERMRDERER
jgi:very-short-patch-repair endonuclease